MQQRITVAFTLTTEISGKHIRPKVIVRAFNESDKESIVQLWQACGLTVPWNDPYKDIERKRQVLPELFLVGEVNGAVIASAMGGYDGHRGWINYLAVSPLHRKKRYGEALVTEVEARLRAIGCPKINLQIRAGNTGVIQFYQKLGFTEDACVSMGKRLIADDQTPGH